MGFARDGQGSGLTRGRLRGHDDEVEGLANSAADMTGADNPDTAGIAAARSTG
jgi:hypothetical protein